MQSTPKLAREWVNKESSHWLRRRLPDRRRAKEGSMTAYLLSSAYTSVSAYLSTLCSRYASRRASIDASKARLGLLPVLRRRLACTGVQVGAIVVSR
jgi:hypothetical protein